MSNFIILSHPRSGTSFLCSKVLTNYEKNIYCFDEIFNNSKITLKKFEYYNIKPFNNNSEDYDKVLTFIDNTKQKIDVKWPYKTNTSFGFKLFHGQLQEPFIKNLIKENKFKIVVLQRKNMLLSAISYEIAKITGQWNKNQKKEIVKLTLNIKNLENFIRTYKTSLENYKKILNKNKIEYIDLFYEDLFTLESINSIMGFIGSTKYESFDFMTSKYKVNDKKRYEKINNIKEIEDYFGVSVL